MVPDPTFRYHTSPVRHVCIISECKDSSMLKSGRQKSLRPRRVSIFRLPCPLTISGETMYEYDTGNRELSATLISLLSLPFERSKDGSLLNNAAFTIVKELQSGWKITLQWHARWHWCCLLCTRNSFATRCRFLARVPELPAWHGCGSIMRVISAVGTLYIVYECCISTQCS